MSDRYNLPRYPKDSEDVAMMIKLERAKNKEYLDYIQEHLSNIATAVDMFKSNKTCCDIVKRNLSDSDNILDYYFELIKSTHDLSKYNSEEFFPYRKKYFPVSDEEKEQVEKSGEYDKAEQHHYLNNQHHWNYWALHNCVNQMTPLAVTEMVIDWIAMSIKFNSTAKSWYESKRDEITLGEKQRKLAEDLLNAFYPE